jgi:hypothetical protein
LKIAGLPLPKISAALRLPGSEAEVVLKESQLPPSFPSFAAPSLTEVSVVVPHPDPAVGTASMR